VIATSTFGPITPTQRTRLRAAYPDALRIYVAMMLARDVDACAGLLRGEVVEPSRLDHARLATARKERLVQLVAPIELLKAAP
jgi:hypothetical protein